MQSALALTCVVGAACPGEDLLGGGSSSDSTGTGVATTGGGSSTSTGGGGTTIPIGTGTGTGTGVGTGTGTTNTTPGGSTGTSAGNTPVTSRSSRTFAIPFKAVVDSEPFACGDEYSGFGTTGATITPSDLRLYIQDVKLLRADGASIPLEFEKREPWQSSQVALLDFEDGSGECSAGTSGVNTTLTGIAPDDPYIGISFTIGVPEALNHRAPATQSDPLKTLSALTWDPALGYPFATIAVREVSAPNTVFGSGLLQLSSSDCASSAAPCSKANRNHVELPDFDPDSNSVVLDIAPIFAQTDLTQRVACEGADTICKTMYNALGVDFVTGEASATQAVFSVE